jgi:hypothetical protein
VQSSRLFLRSLQQHNQSPRQLLKLPFVFTLWKKRRREFHPPQIV